MAAYLGATIDLAHALLMAAWVLGLPLLFTRRWPRATRVYAAYAAAFVVGNLASRHVLGECLLTALARSFWEQAGGAGQLASHEWFTVRIAETVFGLTPSHQAIKTASEWLILVTAVGVLFSRRPSRHRASKPQPGTLRKLDKFEESGPCE
jgi:hypothetical protein